MDEMLPVVRIAKTREEKRQEHTKAWIDRALAVVAILSAVSALLSIYLSHRDATEAVASQSRAMQLDERPFIRVVPKNAFIKTTDWNDASGKFVRRMQDVNLGHKVETVGRTPAFDVNVRYECYPDGENDTDLPNPLMLNESMDRFCDLGTPDLHKQTKARLEGKVIYQDLFHNVHHYTFCFDYEFTLTDKTHIDNPEPVPCPNFKVEYD